jgi:uroporphyrin-III C-methyltransferase
MCNLMKKAPELIVVGAGPGDPDLITLKAMKALRRADIVLYDNLANQEIMNHCSESCEKIYVGKLPYGDYTPQEVIHELIKEKAFTKGTVVRLKGGDPFVFGRGMEEILYARSEGISASYIPGISSMQAAGFEDIPLTHRGISESFWVITGTKKDGTLSEDLKTAIQTKATVVIYMGMKKLEEISNAYIEKGAGNMPAAIIQHASLPHKKMAIGTARELVQMAKNKQLKHPALIVIGEVVGLASEDICEQVEKFVMKRIA